MRLAQDFQAAAATVALRTVLVSLALAAAACTGPADETPPATGAAPAAPAPDAGSAVPSGDRHDVRAAVPPPPPPAAVPPPPPAPMMDPAKLIGLDRSAVTRLLGSPSFLRSDAPAELWRYRAGRCILDLFLYPPGNAPEQPPAVEHVEARQRNGDPATAEHCLDAVLKAHAAEKT